MAFSLSRRSLSRTLGWYGCLFDFFVLVVLFKLFVLLDFFGGAAFRAVIAYEVRAESIERNNLIRISFNNRRARHAAHDPGVFALGDVHSPAPLYSPQTSPPALPPSGHQNS